nr:hypothetical protein B0A51_04150 [Rachicladosporium sp. CCFEE 5018]
MPIHSQDLDCRELMLNIPITANNYVLDIKKATTETELAEFVDELDQDATIDRKQYSYVYAAVNAGYTVLNYDRLGNLFSEKPDPFDAVQGPTEIEILRVLIEKARAGTLLAASDPSNPLPRTLHLPAFDKVVHVAHSLGSQITNAFLVQYGHLYSAATLTGFTSSLKNGRVPRAVYALVQAAPANPAF